MRLVLVFVSCLLATSASASFMCYDARLLSVYDGDTIVADLRLGFDVTLAAQRIRLQGIDAPEIWPLATREAATASRDALQAKLQNAWLTACTRGRERDNFGRVLAYVYADGLDVGQWMLDEGHAKPFGE